MQLDNSLQLAGFDEDRFVSDRTQAIFGFMVASGVDLGNLLALVSSAYADGGHHVLNQLEAKVKG